MIIVGCSFVVVPSSCEATVITPHHRVVSHLLQFFYVGHQGIYLSSAPRDIPQAEMPELLFCSIGQVQFDLLVMDVWWGSVFLRPWRLLQCQVCVSWIRQTWIRFCSLTNREKSSFKSHTESPGSAVSPCSVFPTGSVHHSLPSPPPCHKGPSLSGSSCPCQAVYLSEQRLIHT